MEKHIKKVYTRIQVPNQFREELLEILIGGNALAMKNDSVWRKPGFWGLVATIIIIAIIIYGLWLPNNISI